jgi:diguanylate cyclase (GGDEF)-like protein/PAS domain S-box-containing protein
MVTGAKRSWRQFQALMQNALDGIHIMDSQGNVLEANDSFCNMLGYTQGEVEKLNVADWNCQFARDELLERLRSFVGKSARFETVHRRKDGSRINVEISTTGAEIDGQVYFFASSRDITERKRAEQALKTREERYQTLFSRASEGISIVSTNGSLIAVNESFAAMHGYSTAEMQRMQLKDLDTPASLSIAPDRIRRILADGHLTFEVENYHKDGHIFPMEVSASLVEIDGVPVIQSFSKDITQRKAAEEKIRFLTQIHAAQSQINHALIESKDEGALFDRVCRIAVDLGGMQLAWIGVHDEGTGLLKPVAAYGERTDYLDSITISSRADVPEGRGPSGIAFREGRSVYVQRFQTDPLLAPWGDRLARFGWGASGTVPILRAGKPYAVMAFYHTSENIFSDEIINLLDEAALNIGRGLDRFDLELENLKAQESLRLAAMVYDNSGEAIMVTDAQNFIIAVNPAFTTMTGYTFEDVKGHNPRIFQSGRHDQAFYESMWSELHRSGHWHGEVWDTRKDGELHVKLLTINVIKDAQGEIFRHVALFTDITSRKMVEELVWKQANFDPLTELPNRQMFRDRLEHEATKSDRTGKPLALMLIDLDRFKEVNDTLGHDQGDLLLVEAARRITHCVRKSDTVARLGGDEFVVIVPDLEDVASVERVAQSVIATLNDPFALGRNEAYISASIGITIYQNDSKTLDELFKNVDQAMYVAKNAGRNRFADFTADMQEAALNRMHLANDLRSALAAGQFAVHYQPIVEMASGRIHKAEALLRWRHPARGTVSPPQFIPLAEETGLIVPIGDWVFKEAVAQVKQWRAALDPSFQISVNKSPVQIRHDGGTHLSWAEYLERNGIPGQSIAIEITEGLLLRPEASVTNKLLAFRDAGVQVAVDDFGTGYSSLAYLKEFDIDYLKIDRSFVCNLGQNPDDLVICEAMIVMAHKLGLRVIAEGVETTEQRDLLQAAGCDYAQGYLYSRPLPPHEFEKFVRG